MSVVVVGVNHRTVPLPVLERLTVSAARLPKALDDLRGREHLTEAALLSTCARTEVYLLADRFHGAVQTARDFLAEQSFLAPEDFSDHLYSYFEDAAVTHLFRVATGLDSAVLGETEILGQVARAAGAARAGGISGPVLETLFRRAVEVGRRARNETAISRGITSVSHAAVALAEERVGALEERAVLVLGAGETGATAATALAQKGAHIRVANRTWSRAVEVARKVGAVAVQLGDLGDHLVEVDVLVTSTTTDDPVIVADDLAVVMDARDERPLLVVDLAVPRDVDPAVASLPGVSLLDMTDVLGFARAGRAARRLEVERVESLVADEVERYMTNAATRELAPLIGALHDRAEDIRRSELDRFAGRLAGLTDRQREAVEALTRGIVGKLVHDPTAGLKETAGTAQAERLADLLRALFRL